MNRQLASLQGVQASRTPDGLLIFSCRLRLIPRAQDSTLLARPSRHMKPERRTWLTKSIKHQM